VLPYPSALLRGCRSFRGAPVIKLDRLCRATWAPREVLPLSFSAAHDFIQARLATLQEPDKSKAVPAYARIYGVATGGGPAQLEELTVHAMGRADEVRCRGAASL
jgi:hypothetical protein